VLVDPNYDPSGDNDAALLVLAQPTSAPAIALASPSDSAMWTPGNEAVIAGWGQTSGNGPNSTANALQYPTTVLQDPFYCAAVSTPFDPNGQICANDDPYFDTSTCFGDSGGPLIANQLQGQAGDPTEIGIVRGSSGTCDPSGVSIFTPVGSVDAWAQPLIAVAASIGPSQATPPPLPLAEFALAPLDVSTARTYVKGSLATRFRTRFTRRHGYSTSCRSMSRYTVLCGVGWWYGPNDYWGAVRVINEIAQASFVWTDQLNINWVNDWCYYHSGHRRRCRIYHARGS
jgi:hypothetical protein